jgi:phosphoribosylamine-glycine ligase
VLLVDTPGFDDTVRSDTQILNEIARVLTAQYQLGVELKGVIYIHRITDIRYTRSAIKTLEVFKKICGPDAMKNVLLITSRWTEVDQALGSDRERQLKEKFWSYMLSKGSNMSRFHGDRDSGVSLISQLLCKDTVVLELQSELVVKKKRLDQTAAGAYISENMEDLKAKYEEELAALERLKQDLLENDRAAKRQQQKDWENEVRKLKQLQQEQVSLQRPVDYEVRQEINNVRKKKSGLMKVVPFLPAAISILGMFVGVPPGVTGLLTSWFSDFGVDFGSLGDIFTC